jgi:signal transduction histidine kinase
MKRSRKKIKEEKKAAQQVNKKPKKIRSHPISKGIVLVFSFVLKLVQSVIRAILEAIDTMRGNGKDSLASGFDRFLSLFRLNITFKLTWSYGWITFRFLIFINLLIFFGGKYGLQTYQIWQMENRAAVYVEDWRKAPDSSLLDRLTPIENLRYGIFDGAGNWIASTDQMTYTDIRTDNAYLPWSLVYQDWFISETVLEGGIENPDKVLILMKSTDFIEEIFMGTVAAGWVLALLFWLIAMARASKIAKKHLKPIHTMTENVQSLSASNLSERLMVNGARDELKDLAQTFNHMMDEIEESYGKQRQFVSDASHELRTPIAVIKGYADLLNRWGKDDPEVLVEGIEAIRSETDFMQSLVESLLFLARRDRGTLKMEMSQFSLTELMEEVEKETKMIDNRHEISGQFDSCPQVYASYDKLKQAVRVFVDNCIKYTPDQGQIRLSLRETKQTYAIQIEDNGIGIAKEDQPHIFDRFYRADKSRTRLGESKSVQGTGLGLAIAKVIVEQHGGEIYLESELNKGTSITLFFPKSALVEQKTDGGTL